MFGVTVSRDTVPSFLVLSSLHPCITLSFCHCVPGCCGWVLQPDRVMDFCQNNDLQLIIRAHECVMDGFERFAGGHLITLFSATNYCGQHPHSSPLI